MPNSAEIDSQNAVLRERVACLEREIGELRAAKRVFEQMSVIDGARIRQLERQVRDAAGIANRAHGSPHKSRAGE